MSIADAIMSTMTVLRPNRGMTRTELQKTLYVLSVMTGGRFGFRPQYHGPHSSEVSDKIGGLVAMGFIRESVRPGLDIPTVLGEVNRYEYVLSEGGHLVVESSPKMMQPYAEALHRMDALDRPLDLDIMSVAVLLHHMAVKNAPPSTADIETQVNHMGGGLPDGLLEKAMHYLHELGLAEAGLNSGEPEWRERRKVN